MRVTNNLGISLPLAVWLLHDEYDYVDTPNYISVTTLLRPLRQIVLPPRIPQQDITSDVSEYVARAMGVSIHDSIEKAWKTGYRRSLRLLGHPDHVIDRFVINPTDDFVASNPDCIPIYLEQRGVRELNGWNIGGKFDMVTDGIINDTKSTSAWAWKFGSSDENHVRQMSMYRWIDAARPTPWIKEDYMRVNYVFTDWDKMKAKQDPTYPQKKVEEKVVPLMSLKETEAFIEDRLSLIQRYKNTPESQLPECTDEELWRTAPKYKYYSDPNKTDGKSSKNFDDPLEADRYWNNEKAGKGIVKTFPGEVKRCNFCNAFQACSQKDRYFA